MVRPADPLDGATPSGASLIAEALLAAGTWFRPTVPVDTPRPPTPRWQARLPSWRVFRARAGTGWRSRKPRCADRSRSPWPAIRRRFGAAQCGAHAGAGRGGRGGRASQLVGTADRSRPGERCRRGLRLPRQGVRPAGHHRRGTRRRPRCVRVAFGACPPRKTTPRPSTATSNWPRRARPTTSPRSTPTTPPSRIRSVVRCTSAARRSAASTAASRPRGRGRTRHAAGARPRGGVLLGAHHRSRRGPHAHRDHQRHDIQRRGQDRVDEGLLGPGERHASSRRRRTTSRCSGRSRPPPCRRGRTRGGRTSSATDSAT